MGVTKLSVFNIGQRGLGEPQLSSVDQDVERARDMRAAWEPTIGFLLSIHPWNFATVVEQLSADGGATPVGWDYAYSYPAHWLRHVFVSRTGLRTDALAEGWEDRAGHIMSNDEELYLGFVSDQYVDALVGQWPRPFEQLAGTILGRVVALKATDSRSMLSDLVEQESALFDAAAGFDAQNQSRPPRKLGSWAGVLAGRLGWR